MLKASLRMGDIVSKCDTPPKVVQYQKSIANEFPYLCLNAPSHIAKKKIDHILVQNVHIIEKKATIDNIITQIANIYGFKIHQGYLGK